MPALVVLALMATGAGAMRAAPPAPPAPAAAVPPPEPAPEDQPKGLAASEVDLADGILALEEGRDLAAAELLAAAVAADPQNGTALHWLGLAELRLGRAAAAARTLAAALAARRPPEAGRQRVAADLRAARLAAGDQGAVPAAPPAAASGLPLSGTDLPRSCGGPPPRWEGRLSLEASYDSNPGLLPADATFLPLTRARPAGAATDGGGDLDLRLEAHPFYDRGGFSLGLGVIGNRSAYRNQGDLDLSLGGGFAQLAWGKDPRGFLTGPLGYTRVPVGYGRLALLLQAAGSWTGLGNADFLRQAGGAAALTVNGPGPAATRLDLGASQLRFAGDATGDLRRSGSELSAGIGESLYLGGGGYLRLAASGGAQQAGAAFAHHFVEIAAEAGAPLAAGWTLYLDVDRRQERFDDPQSNLTRPAGPVRDDASWRGSAAAVRMLGERLAFTARTSYVRRDSNVELPGAMPLFAYRRTIAGLGISWFF
ncbi:MAG TPA: hypothetical protein VKY89_01965 [Thermoanaerobaculia bacterium]|nr:hypothetical protein [Thermoanaerobaculia bacterium]